MSMPVETEYQQDDRRRLLLALQETSIGHESENETDRFSALPTHVIALILSYLPLDDAIRTSVLSKQWQNIWKTLTDIVFNKECFIVSLKKEEVRSNEMKLVRAVSQVLENHSGIIRKFEINHLNFTRAHVDIDRWIQCLSNSPVREFILDLWGRRGGRYKVHPSLLECKGLIRLDLWNCSLDHFPSTFGSSFKCLKNLNLYSVPMSQERFEHLVESCPFLEMLYYYHDESYFPTLKIDAPRLYRFKFGGFFDKLILNHSKNLAQVCFYMEWSMSNKSQEEPLAFTSNLIDFFRCLVNVHTLHIKTQFLKYLVHGYVPERLPRPFSNMTTLGIETDPVCKQEIEAILCMLKSFPRLRTLSISVNVFFEFRGTMDHAVGSTNHFQEDKYKGLVLPEVCIVEVSGFSNRFSELNLLELILLACPNLKRLSVVDCISSRGMCPIEDTFRRLRLASRQARATILRRESCGGTSPDLVYVWLNGLNVPYIPPHISESPPALQEI